jgi:hypothetical protein
MVLPSMVRRRSTVRFRNGAPQELPARPGQKLTGQLLSYAAGGSRSRIGRNLGDRVLCEPFWGTSGAGHGQRLQCRAGRRRAPCRRRVSSTRLGTWLNTLSGEGVAAAVMALTPAPFKQDIDLLIEGLQLAAQRSGHFSSFWPADGIWAKTMRSVGRGAQPPRLLLGRSP